MRSLFTTALALVLAAGAATASQEESGRGLVALRAGTVHLVDEGRVLEGGAVILVRDGRIQAVGSDLAVPPDAEFVDYGPDAVIVPGFIASSSSYASGRASARTAEPGLRAIDGFDFYATYASAWVGGVTSAYLSPAEGRLIAGEAAMVKLAGASVEERILSRSAALHGAIDSSARRTPGYWEPPLPATVDVGMGYQRPQLPRTTMGAMVALGEILELARSGGAGELYGPYVSKHLKPLLDARVPWRIAATEASEIRAMLSFAAEHQLQLILDRADGAKELAAEIAAAGASVVFRPDFSPNGRLRDHGKDPDARWPEFDVPAVLVHAGVRVAISSYRARDLLFAAGIASRGGLDAQAALRAITLTPAEMFGVADRVGSIRAGKDADFCVLNGTPIVAQASVLATWIGGERVWDVWSSGAKGRDKGSMAAAKARARGPVVVEADEVHLGDGTVIAPGQVLMRDGRIAEVGARVSHPAGARVVRGKAVMPGMIDALGHLGMQGSRKVPGPDFRLSSIVAPGDRVDRRVAAAGITTVAMAPRGTGRGGAPVLAYKPAAHDFDGQVLADPIALRAAWTSSNRLQSGKEVKSILKAAREYVQKWAEYEAAIAKWTPPPPKSDKEEDEDEDDEEKSEDKDDDDDKKKKKKKKKKGKKELEPDPITGLWQTELVRPPMEDASVLKTRLHFMPGKGSGDVEGNLRCTALTDGLIDVEGHWDRKEKQLTLTGLGSQGRINMTLELDDDGGKLEGKLTINGSELELMLERKTKEWVVAKRKERRAAPDAEKAPKGKPRAPRRDPKLEPGAAILRGEAAMIVSVEREDEILACVEACAEYGVKPVLFGAKDAYKVLDRLKGRIRGILPSPMMVLYERDRGTDYRRPYAELQGAGIRIAFHSAAEEGAAELPLAAAFAVAGGMSPAGAVRALTHDAAIMLALESRVGMLKAGLDADLLVLDGAPFAPGTSVAHTFVNGVEVAE